MAENERLRQQLGERIAGPVQEDTGQDPPDHPDGHLQQQSECTKNGHSPSVVSGIFISASGDSSYHGLTSTLFEGRQDSAQLADPAVPVEPIRKQLMGEAAYQRGS